MSKKTRRKNQKRRAAEAARAAAEAEAEAKAAEEPVEDEAADDSDEQEQDADGGQPAKPPKSRGRIAFEWIRVLFIALFCSVIVRRFLVDVYIVPTESMDSTIIPNDRVIGEKISYHFTEPKRGDVITFDNPLNEKVTFVKRVVAVAGDEVDYMNGSLYVNGERQEEAYTQGRPSYPLIEAREVGHITYPYVVPDGYIWMMGDNRTNSNDSRYFGPVSLEHVSSRVVCVFWPPSHSHGL